MSKDPAFLFYYKDFDSDTADWEADAIGWYVRLLIFQAGNGYIPSDIEQLAQVGRVKFSEYQIFCERWAKRLACKFKTLSDERLYNPKLSKVQSERKSGAVKKSVLAVFGNYIKSNELSVSEEKYLKNEFHKNKIFYEILDDEKRKNEILKYIESIMDKLKNKNAKRTQQEDAVADVNEIEVKDEIIVEPKPKFPFSSKEFLAQWDLWKVFRKKKDRFKFLNIDSENRKLKELENLSSGNEKIAIKIIQQSIDNGWKGFFELKESHKNKSTLVSNR